MFSLKHGLLSSSDVCILLLSSRAHCGCPAQLGAAQRLCRGAAPYSGANGHALTPQMCLKGPGSLLHPTATLSASGPLLRVREIAKCQLTTRGVGKADLIYA